MFFGALASGGSGIIISTFSLAESEWMVQTPLFLRPGSSLWTSLDLIVGALVVTAHVALVEEAGLREEEALVIIVGAATSLYILKSKHEAARKSMKQD